MNSCYYEKRIGLNTLWQMMIRRWKIALVVFAPLVIATIVVSQFVIKKTYQSSASFYNTAGLNSSQHAEIISIIKSEEVANKAIEELSSSHPTIIISTNDIISGLSFESFNSSKSGNVSFMFNYTIEKATQPILASVYNVAYTEIKSHYPNLIKQSEASKAVNISKNNTYLWIGLGSSVVLALGMAFIDEIISDEVYDSDDIRYLGSPAFEITASK